MAWQTQMFSFGFIDVRIKRKEKPSPAACMLRRHLSRWGVIRQPFVSLIFYLHSLLFESLPRSPSFSNELLLCFIGVSQLIVVGSSFLIRNVPLRLIAATHVLPFFPCCLLSFRSGCILALCAKICQDFHAKCYMQPTLKFSCRYMSNHMLFLNKISNFATLVWRRSQISISQSLQ